MKPYRPTRDVEKILDVAWNHVQSVEYSVTARWLFYRLLQDSIFTKKEDYKGRFLPILSRARKAFFKEWRPDTLTDDGRNPIVRGAGDYSIESWFQSVTNNGVECKLDIWAGQPKYLEIWFEAAAMVSQFAHYTRHITLRPFKGDASIDFKWQTAKALKDRGELFPGKPIHILYFGDLDKKGLSIPKSAFRDIQEWAEVDIVFERCGLNSGQPEELNIPENPEKPGTYQWEALNDQAAKKLITEAVGKHFDQAGAETILEREAMLKGNLESLELPGELAS